MSDNTVYTRVVCAGISIVRWKGRSRAAGEVEFVELACVVERAGITIVAGDVSKEARSPARAGFRVACVEIAWILSRFLRAIIDGPR